MNGRVTGGAGPHPNRCEVITVRRPGCENSAASETRPYILPHESHDWPPAAAGPESSRSWAKVAWVWSTKRATFSSTASRRIKVLPAAMDARSRAQAALHPGGQGRLRAEPSEHRHHLRYRRRPMARDFIAMEFVHGKTLADLIPRKRLSLTDALHVRHPGRRMRWRRRTRPASCIAI